MNHSFVDDLWSQRNHKFNSREQSIFSVLLVNSAMGEANSPTDFPITFGCWDPMDISGVGDKDVRDAMTMQ